MSMIKSVDYKDFLFIVAEFLGIIVFVETKFLFLFVA